MGQRNLAPGFTSAQNQTAEQQKAISQERKPSQAASPKPSHYFVSFLCSTQCHLTALGSSCSALKPLFKSNYGMASSWQCVPPLGSLYVQACVDGK